MELSQLQAFVSVTNCGSFRAAANQLGITQPAVSARIAALEQHVGSLLLERTRQSVKLTARGHQVFETAQQMLALRSKLMDGEDTSTPRQTVRLGATSTVVHTWLAQLIEAIRVEIPNLNIELHIDTTPRLRAMMRSYHLDAALLMESYYEPEFISRHLSRCPVTFIGAAAIFGKAPLFMPFREIATHLIMTYAKGSPTFAHLSDLLRETGIANIQLGGCNSTAAIIQIAAEGIAIGTVIAASAQRDLAAGSITEIQSDVELPVYDYVVVCTANRVNRIGHRIAEIAQAIAKSADRSAARKPPAGG